MRPGQWLSSTEDIRRTIEDVNRALASPRFKGFVPDFRGEPLTEYHYNHTLAGVTDVHVFGGVIDGKPLDWHMAAAGDRVWIDRIVLRGVEISEYGVPRTYFDSGALTDKPWEYVHQSGQAMRQFSLERIGTYVDITPIIDLLEPIKAYRSA